MSAMECAVREQRSRALTAYEACAAEQAKVRADVAVANTACTAGVGALTDGYRAEMRAAMEANLKQQAAMEMQAAAAVAETVGGLVSKSEQHRAEVTRAAEQVEVQCAQIKQAQTALKAAIEAEQHELAAAIESAQQALETNITDQQQEVQTSVLAAQTKLEASVTAQQQALEAAVAAQQQALQTTLTGQQAALEAKVAGQQAALERTVTEQQEQLEARTQETFYTTVAALTAKSAEDRERADGQHAQIKEANEALEARVGSELNDTIEVLERTVTELAVNMDAAHEQARADSTELETRVVERLQSCMDGLETRVTSHEVQAATNRELMRDEHTKLEIRVADAMGKLVKMQQVQIAEKGDRLADQQNQINMQRNHMAKLEAEVARQKVECARILELEQACARQQAQLNVLEPLLWFAPHLKALIGQGTQLPEGAAVSASLVKATQAAIIPDLIKLARISAGRSQPPNTDPDSSFGAPESSFADALHSAYASTSDLHGGGEPLSATTPETGRGVVTAQHQNEEELLEAFSSALTSISGSPRGEAANKTKRRIDLDFVPNGGSSIVAEGGTNDV
jgi:hypothetical protein